MATIKEDVEAIKDVDSAHSVASAWRPVFCEIVASFARGDYDLSRGIKHVSPPSPEVASHVRASISDFGERLAELPDETWKTSIAQWMRTYWDVLVDLWTIESGACDLVLSARVYEVAEGIRVDVRSIYVP